MLLERLQLLLWDLAENVPSPVPAAVVTETVNTSADSKAALYALIGVISAALLTALGGVIVAFLGRRGGPAAGIDHTPNDVFVLSGAYSDCRSDLEGALSRITLLEDELDESRSLAEFLLRRIVARDDNPEKEPDHG